MEFTKACCKVPAAAAARVPALQQPCSQSLKRDTERAEACMITLHSLTQQNRAPAATCTPLSQRGAAPSPAATHLQVRGCSGRISRHTTYHRQTTVLVLCPSTISIMRRASIPPPPPASSCLCGAAWRSSSRSSQPCAAGCSAMFAFFASQQWLTHTVD